MPPHLWHNPAQAGIWLQRGVYTLEYLSGGFTGRRRKGPAAWIRIYALFKEKYGNSAALQITVLEFSVVWGRICLSCQGLCVKSSSVKLFFLSLGLSVVPWPGVTGSCCTLRLLSEGCTMGESLPYGAV